MKRIITNNLDRNRNTGEGWLKRIGSASCHLFDEKGMIMAGTDQTPGNSSGVTTGNGKMYIEKGNGHPRTRKIALFILACAGVILLVIVLLWSLVPALFAGTWFGYWLNGMIVTLICTYGIFVSYIVFSGYIRKRRSAIKTQPSDVIIARYVRIKRRLGITGIFVICVYVLLMVYDGYLIESNDWIIIKDLNYLIVTIGQLCILFLVIVISLTIYIRGRLRTLVQSRKEGV